MHKITLTLHRRYLSFPSSGGGCLTRVVHAHISSHISTPTTFLPQRRGGALYKPGTRSGDKNKYDFSCICQIMFLPLYMLLKDGEYGIGLRNRMLWLIIVEVNRLYDAVFLFSDQSKEEEYIRIRKYLMDKINQ